ncbi:MAG: DUF1444 family protein [Planctomycetota bacterium]|nr:DUF1444 family protein [Planctomycetota bacterium]
MASMPREYEAFAEQVVTMLRRLHPEFDVRLVGPREALVNGKHLDLENLYRLVAHDPPRGQEIVEQYLEHLFAGEIVTVESLPFDLARGMIMPRIHHETIFDRLSREMVAHVPFVNDTVVLFVIDMPQMTVSITTEQMVKWRIDTEELDAVARRNLDRYTPELKLNIVDSQEGGRAAIFSEQDGYDAARILMSALYKTLAPELGGDFYVATPARDMFLAISGAPEPFVERLHTRVEHDYKRLPYPITSDLFLVTRDGVAGTRDAA